LSVIVTSRGSIVAICVFLAVYHVVTKGTVRAIWHGVLALSLVGIIFLIGPTRRDLVLEDILHLHDRGRGIGSGFSGRFEYWREAMDGFWKKPIFGYGFRASTFGQIGVGAIHSGYLRLFLDAGLVGGILMILAVVFEGLRRLRLAMQFTTLTPLAAPGIDLAESARINAVACATLAMTLVFWIYEQQYVNIGAVISLVFFLMMAAPAYITTQGVAMRR
jgi:O-antigen ligase